MYVHMYQVCMYMYIQVLCAHICAYGYVSVKAKSVLDIMTQDAVEIGF